MKVEKTKRSKARALAKKSSFFTEVAECFSGYFDLISTLAGALSFAKATLNVLVSHRSQDVGPEKSLPW